MSVPQTPNQQPELSHEAMQAMYAEFNVEQFGPPQTNDWRVDPYQLTLPSVVREIPPPPKTVTGDNGLLRLETLAEVAGRMKAFDRSHPDVKPEDRAYFARTGRLPYGFLVRSETSTHLVRRPDGSVEVAKAREHPLTRARQAISKIAGSLAMKSRTGSVQQKTAQPPNMDIFRPSTKTVSPVFNRQAVTTRR